MIIDIVKQREYVLKKKELLLVESKTRLLKIKEETKGLQEKHRKELKTIKAEGAGIETYNVSFNLKEGSKVFVNKVLEKKIYKKIKKVIEEKEN